MESGFRKVITFVGPDWKFADTVRDWLRNHGQDLSDGKTGRICVVRGRRVVLTLPEHDFVLVRALLQQGDRPEKMQYARLSADRPGKGFAMPITIKGSDADYQSDQQFMRNASSSQAQITTSASNINFTDSRKRRM